MEVLKDLEFCFIDNAFDASHVATSLPGFGHCRLSCINCVWAFHSSVFRIRRKSREGSQNSFLASTYGLLGSTARKLREGYEDIMGVLELCNSNAFLDFGRQRLVQPVIDASGSNRGMAAGILNGLIGSYCVHEKMLSIERLTLLWIF
jgi:hypothetical protein